MKTLFTIERHEHDISTTHDKICSGCTLGKDADPVIIATFNNKPDAVTALKSYTASVDRVNSYTVHVTEFWLHEYNADDTGEPLNDGSDEYTQCRWAYPIVYDNDGYKINFNAAVILMDNEIREELHAKLSPCTEQEFYDAYCKAHLEKYGEDFTI